MDSPKTKVLLLAVFVLGIFGLSHLPFFFTGVTFLISLLIFGRIESDRNQHEWHFYVQKGHYNHSVIKWLRTYGKVEVIARSFAVAAMAAILFSGEDHSERLAIIRYIFVASTAATFGLLMYAERKFHLIGSRWAYTRGSVFAGIIFSLLLALLGPRVGFMEAVSVSWHAVSKAMPEGSILEWIPWWAENGSFIETWKSGAEAINTLTQLLPVVVTSMLDVIPGVPTWLARVFATILSFNLLYGFIVLPYAMIMARVWDSNFFVSQQFPKEETAPIVSQS